MTVSETVKNYSIREIVSSNCKLMELGDISGPHGKRYFVVFVK